MTLKAIAAPDFAALREALAREVRTARDRDTLASIRIVTPSDLAREETRRALAQRLGGFVGITVVSIAEWIRELAGAHIHREGGRRMAAASFDRLTAQALLATAPEGAVASRDPLHGLRDTTGVTRLFSATIEDLLQSRHDPDEIDDLRDEDPLRETLAAVFREAHRRMVEARRFDRCREEATAADVLRSDFSRAVPDVLFVFGFHDLTSQQRAVVEAAAHRTAVTLFIPGPGGTGEGAAASLLEWVRDRGPLELAKTDVDSLLTICEPFFGSAEISNSNRDAVELVTYSEESSEIRGIARRIRREMETQRRAFDEFLIVIPRDGPSPRLVRRIFAKAGIPLADRAGIPVSQTFEGKRAAQLARDLLVRSERPSLASWPDAAAFFREHHRRELSAYPNAEIEEAIAAVIDAHEHDPVDSFVFARELLAALDVVRHRTPSRGESAEGRVLLIRVDQARGISRPVVFYPGFTAGAILSPPREDPLLPDRLRDALNTRHAHSGRMLPLRGAGNDESVLLLRFALECASEKAVLSWAKRERTGGPLRLPAGILVDFAAAHAERVLDPGGADFLAIAPPDLPAFARDLPVDLTDLELSFVRAEGELGETDLARLFAENGGAFLEPALEGVRSRWQSGSLTAHDGILHSAEARQAVRNARARKKNLWSATGLERALTCPFSFFVQDILGLAPPSLEQDDYTPMESGKIIHTVLEQIYRSLDEDGLLPLQPDHLSAALEKLDRALDVERELLASLPAAQRLARSATFTAIRQDLASLLSREAHTPAAERTVPLRFELCFGFDFEGAYPALEWKLPSGRTILIRGRIDRIDSLPDGSLEVVDYKSGKIKFKWGEIAGMNRERSVITLQLALYAEAAQQSLGYEVSRALLRSTASGAVSKEAGLTREHLAEHRPAIERFLDRALDLVEQGWFPSLPGTTCCRDELACACGPSVRARFNRKRGDPELESHLTLLRDTA